MRIAFSWIVVAVFFGSNFGFAASRAENPSVVLLWDKAAPGAVGDKPEDKPSVTQYAPAPEKKNGTAIVVCPGGGYGGLAVDHEGRQIAEWLVERGVTAFILKYRLGPRYRHPAPMLDAQRAVRLVRARAGDWKLDAKRIGIWGFSAGGHLASTVGTHFDQGMKDSSDPIERASCRPDFMILSYPVITLEPPFAHMGSRANLLGKNPDAKLVDSLCNDRQVKPDTPPTFLMHTDEDKAVPPENSIMFYLALKKARVPAELHIYEKGRHGVGLAAKDPVLSSWPERLAAWMKGRQLLP